MSFLRHTEIYPSDGGAGTMTSASAHRLDEFPVSYSLAGCSPAEPASASLTTASVHCLCLAEQRNSANGNLSLIRLSQPRGALQATQPPNSFRLQCSFYLGVALPVTETPSASSLRKEATATASHSLRRIDSATDIWGKQVLRCTDDPCVSGKSRKPRVVRLIKKPRVWSH